MHEQVHQNRTDHSALRRATLPWHLSAFCRLERRAVPLLRIPLGLDVVVGVQQQRGLARRPQHLAIQRMGEPGERAGPEVRERAALDLLGTARLAGALHTLAKPFTVEELRSTVGAALDGADSPPREVDGG